VRQPWQEAQRLPRHRLHVLQLQEGRQAAALLRQAQLSACFAVVPFTPSGTQAAVLVRSSDDTCVCVLPWQESVNDRE
jgi:hypothetical protein